METRLIEEPLLDPEQAAELLQMPVATLTAWRAHRTGPRFFRLGRRVRYSRSDLERWLEERANAGRGAAA